MIYDIVQSVQILDWIQKPTPVSALIHAATLVTAGLYLLVRSSPILEYSSTALLVITLVGASTAFMAATCGLVQNDLKRIIAFSTISQLGYPRVLGKQKKQFTFLNTSPFQYVPVKKAQTKTKIKALLCIQFKRGQHNLSKVVKPLLDPWYVTGFTDGEGCFTLSIAVLPQVSTNQNKTRLQVNPIFSIHLHSKDIFLLESIKDYFGVGTIYQENNTNSASYKVLSVTELNNVIIPHFDKYPLLSQKLADYLLWKEAIQILVNKEHLSQNGLEKILGIRSSLNLGLSPSLKNRFPNIMPVARPKVENKNIPNPNWILGFTEGEGCFIINKQKSQNTANLKFSVWLELAITLHSRDKALLEQIRVYLSCGKVYSKSDQKYFAYRIARFDDIFTKVIPFFQKYPLIGDKNKNFKDWCLAADLLKKKEHFTEAGIAKIISLKENMNRGRK